MRLFLAIPVTGTACAKLEAALARWRRAAPGVRWEAPRDWHITLKFLGAWPDAREQELIAALDAQPWPRLRLQVMDLGTFPSLRRPAALWAGVMPRAELAAWAERLQTCLQPLGVAPERRAFTPHITLARVRTPHAAAPLRGEWEQPPADWGTIEADGMALYETLPLASPAGGRYRQRRQFPSPPSV